MNDDTRYSESGFTLVEVLVTVLILGLLAAVVFPVVIPQVNKADPTKASNDLANLKSSVELFQLEVRPTTPGDIEDLANQITTSDADVDGGTYATGDSTKWDGPYVDLAHPEVAVATTADTATTTGFDAPILSDLYRFNTATSTENNTSSEPAVGDTDFVAMRILDLTVDQFEDLNDQIDGEGETDGPNDGESQEEGNLRFDTGTADLDGDTNNDTVTYFLAVPFKD